MTKFQTPSMTSLSPNYRAAVIGSTGAIGTAIATALRDDPRCSDVRSFARRPQRGETPIDLTDEASISAAAGHAEAVHLLFIAAGGLTIGEHWPEKALSRIDPEGLRAQFDLNAIGPVLVLKHFVPKLVRRERSLVGVLSARVGSIGDNRLGGWYGYRAAKAALNQYLRAAAIEVARTRKQAVIAALHPGTVESALSKPFRPEGAARAEIFTPDQSAYHLLTILNGLAAEQTGMFWDYAGRPIPW